jgi:hypothetical protein
MHVRRENDEIIMTESLVCSNYYDMSHFGSIFEKVGENEYKCKTCSTVMVFKEPVLIHDNKGRVRMKVVAETKQ